MSKIGLAASRPMVASGAITVLFRHRNAAQTDVVTETCPVCVAARVPRAMPGSCHRKRARPSCVMRARAREHSRSPQAQPVDTSRTRARARAQQGPGGKQAAVCKTVCAGVGAIVVNSRVQCRHRCPELVHEQTNHSFRGAVSTDTSRADNPSRHCPSRRRGSSFAAVTHRGTDREQFPCSSAQRFRSTWHPLLTSKARRFRSSRRSPAAKGRSRRARGRIRRSNEMMQPSSRNPDGLLVWKTRPRCQRSTLQG